MNELVSILPQTIASINNVWQLLFAVLCLFTVLLVFVIYSEICTTKRKHIRDAQIRQLKARITKLEKFHETGGW